MIGDSTAHRTHSTASNNANSSDKRGRSTSIVSYSSNSSLVSTTSDNSALSETSTPGGCEASKISKIKPPLGLDAVPFLSIRSPRRSRSFSRGRQSSHGSINEERQRNASRPSRSKPRSSHQGPIYQILSNFKPFSRDKETGDSSSSTGPISPGAPPNNNNSNPMATSGIVRSMSPSQSSNSSVYTARSSGEVSDPEEFGGGNERGRRTLRNMRGHTTDRSESPGPRRLKFIPSLSTLVPSAKEATESLSASSIVGTTRRVLSRRSRSSSRTRLGDPNSNDSSSITSASPNQPALPQQANVPRRRRSSSTTLKSHLSAASDILQSLTSPQTVTNRSESTLNQPSETESIRHVDLPRVASGIGFTNRSRMTEGGNQEGIGFTGRPSGHNNGQFTTEDRPHIICVDAGSGGVHHHGAHNPNLLNTSGTSSKRGSISGTAASPVSTTASSGVGATDNDSIVNETVPPSHHLRKMSSQGQYSIDSTATDREKPCYIRVYRPDGTFGTIACPLDISADLLLQLAARKFFISDAAEYHLVALRPDSTRILTPDSKPAQMIRSLLVHAGYHSTMDRLNDVSRDDTSFLCRIVLANINEPLRPPLLMQGLRDLVLVDTDVRDAPSLACPDARHVETLDVSRSAFEGTSTIFPRLTKLRMSRMGLLNGFSPSLSAQMRPLMTHLTMLDLSGCGVADLNCIDFMQAPNLKYLDLRGNQLIELPSTLLHLPFLETLLCGTNALLNFHVWNPSLCRIDLSYNNFSRLILTNEQALQMVNLKTLQLCANALTTLPESFHLLPKLRELDVRHNMILNPMDTMSPTLHRLIASYNNPRLPTHSSSEPSTFNIGSEGKNQSIRFMPQIKQLKLEGLRTLELHETFSMARITSLDMRNTHMPYVHESLFQNTPNLQTLNLSNNSLTRLPISVRDLFLLEELYVSNNSLVDLPSTLFELQNLRLLDAHANNLKQLPQAIMLAPKLKILNLASNLVASLPSNMTPTSTSPIVQLTLCDNQLTEECFEVVLQLTTLRILDLSYNFITELPSGVFSQLPGLEELYLSGNRISTLPHDDFVYATQLRVLRVNGNKLPTLPGELSKATNLEVLDAAANQLRYNVANWPFDWNWRWNQKLRYLNFSSNRRLEIRKSIQFVDDNVGTVDLADLCVLPKLATLGLMDVTLTTNSVPFQTENCRVRTFGSDLHNFRIGIAENLGFRPLANNDLVVERFRNRENEFLVAMFDGQNEYPGSGNKISHLAQDAFASILKKELQVKDTSTVDALRRAFLATHREIGNIALLSPEEIAHTSLGHRSSTASRLGPRDWSSGTGATVLYFQGQKMYIATVGGARVVLSRSNGTHTVLSKPLPPVSAELDRIRSAGGIVDPSKSYVNNMSAHPRLIGCYTAGTVFSAAPSIYEYEFEALNVSDQIIIGSSAMWEVMRHETAADIVRSSSQDPVLGAMKLRDFTMAYGMRDRMMAMVIGRPWSQTLESLGRQHSAGDLYDDELVSYRKRRQELPEDSTLARLGTEVSPPFGDVTMVFTDIKNSTYLWESYPSVMRAAIKTHNSLMRRSIRLMDGYEVKNEGDAFIISFHTPVKALIWCLTVQQHLLTAEWPPELLSVNGCSEVRDAQDNIIFRGLSVRMGIHCGRPVAEPDPVTKRMDYFGPMVNRASRISGIALGGQISVSADFLNTLERNLSAHKRVKEGMAIEEAYSHLSPANAASLERSATVLDHTEYVIREFGELKLRGIENPEHIYNIYPISLASRQKFYDENDAGERQSHAEIHPVIISTAASGAERNLVNTPSGTSLSIPGSPDPSVGVPRAGSAGSLGAGNGMNAPRLSDGFQASLCLPTMQSLSGLAPAIPGPNPGDTSSTPASPFFAPEEIGRRPSEGGISQLSRRSSRSSRSYDFGDHHRPDSRMKHMSLHLNPNLAAGAPVIPVDTNTTNVVNYLMQLQSVARRLEALTIAGPSGLSLQRAQLLMEEIEPAVQVEYPLSEMAQLLWLTRIENCILRLQLQVENQNQN